MNLIVWKERQLCLPELCWRVQQGDNQTDKPFLSPLYHCLCQFAATQTEEIQITAHVILFHYHFQTLFQAMKKDDFKSESFSQVHKVVFLF